VLHDHEQHLTPEQQMVGETKQQAPKEQVALDEASEKQEGVIVQGQ
jgi:hypothetical protein